MIKHIVLSFVLLVAAQPAAAHPETPAVRHAVADPIVFEVGSHQLTAAGHEALAAVAAALQAHPEHDVVWVEGHADELSTPAWSQQLSRDRADAVVAFLTARGVSEERLVPIGVGERPLAGRRGAVRTRSVAFFDRAEQTSDLVAAVKTYMQTASR